MKTASIEFEKALSFRPQIARERYGKEPCIRDLIFQYYRNQFRAETADELTKAYTDQIFQMLGIES
jgi:hypothetical protein